MPAWLQVLASCGARWAKSEFVSDPRDMLDDSDAKTEPELMMKNP